MVARECTLGKWRLIDYFDVWGNAEDGYEVNNQSIEFEDLIITDDATDQDIFNYLKDVIGYFGPEAKFEDMSFDGDDMFIEISTTHNGAWYPLCRLERVV